MPFLSTSPSPWAHICGIIFFTVLAFACYVGVRFVDRATATMNSASALLDSGVASGR